MADLQLQLRQNKDLIESLNEVYQMNTAFSHELEALKAEIDSLKEEQTEKMLKINNTLLETSNNLNKRLRVYQSAQESIAVGLAEINTFKEDMEKMKENSKIMQLRMTNLKNDMIALQSHIINAPDLTVNHPDPIDVTPLFQPQPHPATKYSKILDPRTTI
jgi:chromosome segregation ATPase